MRSRHLAEWRFLLFTMIVTVKDPICRMVYFGFGIVQVGLSLKSHDPSQRANGFLTFAGGVIITFAKEILNLITG